MAADIQPTQACVGAAKIAYNAYYSMYPQMVKAGKGSPYYESLLGKIKTIYGTQWSACLKSSTVRVQNEANEVEWISNVPHPLPSA